MFVDLLMLTIIGCILEFLCTRYGALVLNATPFTYISLLMAFVAIVRWKLWGLLTIPALVGANFLAGQFLELPEFVAVYDWRFYLSAMIGIASMGVNVIFYKKNANNIVSSSGKLVLIMILDYLLVSIVQIIVYRLLTSGSLLEGGVNIVYANGQEINVCKYGEGGFVYNLFGFAVLVVGTFILRSQGTVCDRTQKFIDDKRNAELDRIDAASFTIQETAEEEAIGEVDSNEKDK